MYRSLSWLGSLLLASATALDYGSFEDPANIARVKLRYWLPDASVDVPTVQKDIKNAGSIGAGGVELLPLYNYGGSLAPPPDGSDWATYGFGTPAFNTIFKASLQTAKDNGMLFDFALGASMGQGVPSVTTDPGLHWDLTPFNTTVPRNGSFNGVIPGWGTGDLVALVSAESVSSYTIRNPASSTFSTPSTKTKRLVLKSDSLAEQTDKVDADGRVNLHFNTTGGRTHHLFAFYQYQDLAKNLDIQLNTTGTIFDNGSYTVDHFSSRGAKTTINFWETYILNDTEILALLKEVGRYGWEDSMEIKSNISWSPSMPQTFQDVNGYSLLKYLPLVMYKNNDVGVQTSYPGTLDCVLDTEDGGNGYLNDFRAALARGYGDYLATLTSWLENLGLEFSAQVSYNFPIDMEANIARVSAPECESLAFNNNIDGYRQFSGVANAAQKKVVSNEMGADLGKAFALPLAQLLGQINRAFAGGVNQIVLHGQTYTGNYYGTTWPGFVSFFMLFSESYMDKQPAWLHGYPDLIEHVSRNQYILHMGQPQTDVALYNKVTMTDPQLSTIYEGNGLLEAGYTHTYLAPENFGMDSVHVNNSHLAPESPTYKTLVITDNQNMTLSAVQQIQQFADAGLPVVISGSPGYYPTHNASTDGATKAALAKLRRSQNVHSVAAGKVAEKLRALDLLPRVQVRTNGTWYPVMRTDNDTDYVFVFADNVASSGSITVQTTHTPYIFNTWTGRRDPVLHYQVTNNSAVTIPLALAVNQTVVFAFSDSLASEIDTPPVHATSLPSNIIGYNYSTADGLVLHAAASRSLDQQLRLSNGTTHQLSGKTAAPAMHLSNWTLTAEHWAAPANMSDAAPVAVKHNTTHKLRSPSLPSWLDIPGLHNASGVGYYTTSFTWPPQQQGDGNKSTADGAYIIFPSSNITHGLRVSVNGHALPPLDFAAPRADIGQYLVQGTNEITAVVPTMMWNYLKSIYGKLEFAGSKPMSAGPLAADVDTGLIGVVDVVPYVDYRVEL